MKKALPFVFLFCFTLGIFFICSSGTGMISSDPFSSLLAGTLVSILFGVCFVFSVFSTTKAIDKY